MFIDYTLFKVIIKQWLYFPMLYNISYKQKSVSFNPTLLFSLSLSLFFRLIPWSTEVLCVQFPASASKTQSRRLSASSFWLEGALHLHTGDRAPAASINRASPLSGALLPFCVNQGILASILSSLPSHLTDPVQHEGTPGSCWGWTPASGCT